MKRPHFRDSLQNGENLSSLKDDILLQTIDTHLPENTSTYDDKGASLQSFQLQILTKILCAKADNTHCHRRHVQVGHGNSELNVKTDGLLVRRSPFNGALRITLLASLRQRTFLLSHHPTIAEHPANIACTIIYDANFTGRTWLQIYIYHKNCPGMTPTVVALKSSHFKNSEATWLAEIRTQKCINCSTYHSWQEWTDGRCGSVLSTACTITCISVHQLSLSLVLLYLTDLELTIVSFWCFYLLVRSSLIEKLLTLFWLRQMQVVNVTIREESNLRDWHAKKKESLSL